MHKQAVLLAKGSGSFRERLDSLEVSLREYLSAEKAEGRSATFAKVFLSDPANQKDDLLTSPLPTLLPKAVSVVGQTPVCVRDGATVFPKAAVLVITSDCPEDFVFHSLRLGEEECRGKDSYAQTRLLFDKYLAIAEENGWRLDTHCVRTWIYVKDIDNNYEGMVRARNDVFAQHGLSADTHFIASTGIGGSAFCAREKVAIDFITFPAIKESDKTYLQAPEHLRSPHAYGVAFERATAVDTLGRRRIFISGTASIDKDGNILYEGDVRAQTRRLLENIDALLHDGGASLDDAGSFVIYLRDISDAPAVEDEFSRLLPGREHITVQADVCRPGWLVEMECSASIAAPPAV